MASDFSQIFKKLFFLLLSECLLTFLKKGLQQEGNLVLSLTRLPLKTPHISNINMNTNHSRANKPHKHRSDFMMEIINPAT